MPNEIHLFGAIGPTRDGSGITAQMVKTQLAAMDQSEPLIVRIDSEGGSVFDGLSIYEAFRAYPGPKKAVIESTAFSIASYIACAFDDVEIAANGYFMIHEPSTETGGTQHDLARSVELLKKLDVSMVEAYSRKTGLGEDEVRAIMRAESFYNATEAMSLGLASAVSSGAVATRITPQAKHTRLPQRVFTALFSAGSDGDLESAEEDTVADSPKPKAASIKEIKASFPKMSSDFVLKCVEDELPMASVAAAAAEELTSENEDLMAKLAAQEEELVALRAKVGAMDEETPEAMDDEEDPAAMDDEEEPAAKAKAKRNGVAPVARRQTTPTKDVLAEWNSAVQSFVAKGMKRPQAVIAANKANPRLREQVVAAANARR